MCDPVADETRRTDVAHKKVNLPSKVCVRCGRPFSWRKKWQRVWGEVKYCSERCRREKRTCMAEDSWV
ncbi:DUF2256 domain-containing protein [Neptunomonas marina]|uniref:DUF2256 domain-containing protein n=1 Tax=Neptunomonas marina TaxID=1815562 RepID=UPI00197CF3B1|nr:DUF2256 domain-containing protein [Neptunomonas marina]